jgi:dihydroorotate dehydrogenase (fumarate)
MVDLSTTYLGLKLKNPLVASASPLSEKVDTVCRLEEAGIAGVVMYSLFEEQVVQETLKLDRDLSRGADSHAEASAYLPDLSLYTGRRYKIGPEAYAERLHRLKNAVSIPVIGSLNGISTGGWIEYATLIEQAGAAALELNLYNVPSNPAVGAAHLEDQYIDLVRAVRAKVSIPLAVKLSPFFTALPSFAARLVEAGANGLVLFNRFYQPDFDLEALEVVPNLVLSSSQELRLPLRWIAILYGRIAADFALTTGVHTAEDMLKAVMAGAAAVMMASALLKRGISYPTEVLSGVQAWMEAKEYASIEQMKGSMSQQAVARPEAFERANYMKVLESYVI